MSATLVISRPSRLADLVWPYELILDGQPAGQIRNQSSLRTPIAPGPHRLSIRSLHVVNRRLGLGSPTATFEIAEGETVQFACHPRPFVQDLFWWFACLFGERTRWIVLTRADSTSSERASRAHQAPPTQTTAGADASTPVPNGGPSGTGQANGPGARVVIRS
jgi:hypothetical protein